MTPAKRKLIRIIVALGRLERSYGHRGPFGQVGRLMQRINANLVDLLGELDPPARMVVAMDPAMPSKLTGREIWMVEHDPALRSHRDWSSFPSL